jgi:putative peptidoglycan lipid II flippase
LARAAIIIFFAYLLSNLTGYVQRAVIVAQFGSGSYALYDVANRVPELLFQVLAGGALASAFIPAFAGYLGKSEYARAWSLARTTALAILVILSLFAIVSALLAMWLIQTFVAPGFDLIRTAQAASLMRVMLIATVIFGMSGLLMGILQSSGTFLAPALAPALYNIGIIFGAWWFSELGILGASIGVVIGACLHLAIQLPSLFGLLQAKLTDVVEAKDRPTPTSTSRDLREILRLMLPRMAGLGATQTNFMVNTALASGMGDVAITALGIGFPTMRIPQAAIAQAIAQALFPTVSAHAAKSDMQAFGRMLIRAVNVVIVLSLPATIVLIAFAEPIIRVLYRRGNFDDATSNAVAIALGFFSVGLIGHCVFEVVVRGFYALRDTFRPVVITVAGAVLNIILSVSLSSQFARWGWQAYGGIALANSIATLLEAGALLFWLERRTHFLAPHYASLWRAFGKSAVASFVMLAVLVEWRLEGATDLLGSAVALSLGAASYLLTAWGLNIDELKALIEPFANKLIRQ